MALIQLSVDADGDSRVFDAEQASIVDRVSHPYEANLWVKNIGPSHNLEELIGQPMSLRYQHGAEHEVVWMHGVCLHVEHIRTGVNGATDYEVALGPALSLLGYRTNYRHFQQVTCLEIVETILSEWEIEHRFEVSEASYPILDIRIQYGQSDLEFIHQLLEHNGISYFFVYEQDKTVMVLHDAPQTGEPTDRNVRYTDTPSRALGSRYVTSLRFRRDLHPGRTSVRGYDYRRSPDFELGGSHGTEHGVEREIEDFRFHHGAYETSGHERGETPAADDRGAVRGDVDRAQFLAQRRGEAMRAQGQLVDFITSCLNLHAGRIFHVTGHPRADFAESGLIVHELRTDLHRHGVTTAAGVAGFTTVPHRPRRRTAPAMAHGLETATVVGPADEEIHTDESGRVRVQFHWDREGAKNEESSCWVRVSYGWAGASFGMVSIPRIGQEVVVGFLGGDPHQPVVIGRLYNAVNPPPHRLPENKTVSLWRSRSTPDGEDGANEIQFEDRKGKELFYVRAQRNHRRYIRHDEHHYVVNHRSIDIGGKHDKEVGGDERRTIAGARSTYVAGREENLTGGEQHRRTDDEVRETVVGDWHQVNHGVHRVLVRQDEHRIVMEDQREATLGKRSVKAGDLHLEVAGQWLTRSPQIHTDSDTTVVEASGAITLRVGASFITLRPDHVAISGPTVLINSGGTAVPGIVARPEGAEKAEEAVVDYELKQKILDDRNEAHDAPTGDLP